MGYIETKMPDMLKHDSILSRFVALTLTVAFALAPLAQVYGAACADDQESACGTSAGCCCSAAADAADSAKLEKATCGCEVSESDQPAELPLLAVKTVTSESGKADIAPQRIDTNTLGAATHTPHHKSDPPRLHSPPLFLSNCSLLI